MPSANVTVNAKGMRYSPPDQLMRLDSTWVRRKHAPQWMKTKRHSRTFNKATYRRRQRVCARCDRYSFGDLLIIAGNHLISFKLCPKWERVALFPVLRPPIPPAPSSSTWTVSLFLETVCPPPLKISAFSRSQSSKQGFQDDSVILW